MLFVNVCASLLELSKHDIHKFVNLLTSRILRFIFRVHYVNRIQDNVTNCAGNNESKDAESTKKKDLGTPTKINSLLEFQSVVTATSTSTTLTSTSTTESELKNENEIQMIKTSDKKDDHGCLEISFHIKEAWNIFEVRTVRVNFHHSIFIFIYSFLSSFFSTFISSSSPLYYCYHYHYYYHYYYYYYYYYHYYIIIIIIIIIVIIILTFFQIFLYTLLC